MFRYQTIIWQNKMFQVKRKIQESHKPVIDKWKTALGADTVLRKDGFIWFCDEIQDTEIMEMIPWKDS